jgi:4,5-DOPA dioxygenase extradiol
MKRSDFIKTLGLAMATTPLMGLADWKKNSELAANTTKAPLLFIGHGNPMYALTDNAFTQTLAKLGKTVEKPKAILVISAHWLTKGTWVAATPKPETIHDFGGFPQALFDVQYPAAGSPTMAAETQTLLKEKATVGANTEWGLDHGAWTILKHIYPNADVPVFELSIDYYQTPQYHYDLAKYLSKLRDKGVMIIGSGNIVHNLGRVDWNNPNTGYDWTIEFDEAVKKHINDGNHKPLIEYTTLTKGANLAVPTNDHYLPLLYTLALQEKGETPTHIYEGNEMGSISMRRVLFS